MKTQIKTFLLSLAMACFTSTGYAAKLFAIEFTYSGGTVLVEDSSLPDLVNDLIKNKGAFSGLSGEDQFSGSLRYFGVPDALKIAVDRTDPQLFKIRLTSALTGLDATLTAVDEDDMKRKLSHWFYLDGGPAAADLVKASVKASAAAITDGSPGSTTALMADTAFHTFGMFQNSSREQAMRGFESGAHVGLWITEDVYELNTLAGPMEGTRTRVNLPLWLHFGSRISLAGNAVFDFNTLEGTEFYGLGGDVGLAFRPVLRTGEDRFGWQVTPYAGAYGIGSIDGVTAAIVTQHGLINRFEWRLFKRSLIALINQYTSFDNLTIQVDGSELTTPVKQNIIKNGIMLDVPVFSLRSLFANAYFIDTRFLEEANTDNYQTLGGGLSYRLKKFSLNATVGVSKADDYQGLNTGLGFVWDL